MNTIIFPRCNYFYQIKKLKLRQQLGLRDDSVYNTHAGQGATKSNKRQG
jgi:hypothetical protein